MFQPFGTDAPLQCAFLCVFFDSIPKSNFSLIFEKASLKFRLKGISPFLSSNGTCSEELQGRGRWVSESLFRFMLCKESKRNLPTDCKLIGESHESSMPKTRIGDGRGGVSRPVRQNASANNSGATICNANAEIGKQQSCNNSSFSVSDPVQSGCL